MKKLLLMTMLSILSFCVFAQENLGKELPNAEERAEMITQIMTEKLDLTKDQIPHIKRINLKAALDLDHIKQMTNKMEKFKAFRTSQQKKNEDVKKILTKEQYKKYKKSQEELKKLMKQKMKEKKNQKK